MPGCGGWNPLPMRLGGKKARAKQILDSLAAARGTAFAATDPTTIVYLETLAIARALARAWGSGRRVAYSWDPMRMPKELVPRWEKILGLVVQPTDSIIVRRTRIKDHFARFGVAAVYSTVKDILRKALGPVFFDVEFLSPEKAIVHVPDNTYPWGTVMDGAPWYSTVAKILIRTQRPPSYTEGDFLDAVAKIPPALDDVIAGDQVWDWYRPGSKSVAVPGGPSAAGFYLDDPLNLDYQVFDE